jgi:hypothetical protein
MQFLGIVYKNKAFMDKPHRSNRKHQHIGSSLLTNPASFPHFAPFLTCTPCVARILKYICLGKFINTN